MENSEKQERLNALFLKMIAFDEGDPKRIQHFVKVHSFAKLIGELEKLDDHTLYTLEAAAYLHDIGIRIAEEKFGRNDGKLQEQEGPEPAGKLMRECGFEEDVISRVQYLIAHHHLSGNRRTGLPDSGGGGFPGQSVRGGSFRKSREDSRGENFPHSGRDRYSKKDVPNIGLNFRRRRQEPPMLIFFTFFG